MPLQFSFGTAGIRAPMGGADHQLNLSTVRAIAYAVVRQLETLGDDARERGLCVGFDGRRNSRDFAAEVCRVAVAAGFMVRLFAREVPTPVLAFTTRSTGAVGGVMITASHNPPEDNGIKLYLAGGAQVVAPHDRDIARRIACCGDSTEIPRVELELALAAQRLVMLDPDDLGAYLDAVESVVPCRRDLPLPKLAYSATCGVGSATARALFARIAATQVVEVQEQAAPAGDFGGLRSPNPEEPEAVEKLFALAEREQVAFACAHDPDADRLAVLARTPEGALRRLSGDEVGALLGSFLLEQHPHPERVLLASTHVSGGLLEEVARAHGAQFLRTPTGFKWIATEGRAQALAQQRELLFGYEEALGYAFFAMAEDKDGSAAMYVLCELARRLHAQGKSLLDRLDELSRQHGVFASRQLNVRAQGASGPARIAGIMSELRAMDPTALLGVGAVLDDYEQAVTPLPLLIFRSPTGARVCVRPSGTEPKLKLYLHVRTRVQSGEAIAATRQRAEAHLNELERLLHQLTQT